MTLVYKVNHFTANGQIFGLLFACVPINLYFCTDNRLALYDANPCHRLFAKTNPAFMDKRRIYYLLHNGKNSNLKYFIVRNAVPAPC